MSSKFPSLEEIDSDLDFQTSNANDTNNSANDEFDLDTGADFLSREKELLGDDAKEFATSDDAKVQGEPDEIAEFKSSFPALDTADTPSTQNTTAASLDATSEDDNKKSSPDFSKLSLEDSSAVREWRERQALEIQRRDEVSESKRKETRETAMKAIDDFYDNYSNKKESHIDEVREQEKAFIEERDNSVTGTIWDRALKLIDTSNSAAKSAIHDKTRFRDVLLTLKGNKDAPGAAGY